MPGEMCLENGMSGQGSREAARCQTEPPGTGPSEGLPSVCRELRDVGLAIRKHVMELGFLPFNLDAFTCFSQM